MPSQRLRELHAVGGAVAEGAADSTRFRTTERDRLTGDTIVAHFDTAASLLRDTTSKPRIQTLVANGHATSLQHLPPRDTTLRTPAIVYVVGRGIDVNFDSGAVKRVQVRDDSLATGLYLEPERDSLRVRRAPAAGAPTAPASTPVPTGTTAPTVPARRP